MAARKAKPKAKSKFTPGSESGLIHVGTVRGVTPEKGYVDASSSLDDHGFESELPVHINENGIWFVPDCGDPGFAVDWPTWDVLVAAVEKER